jgi:hypothetical protein
MQTKCRVSQGTECSIPAMDKAGCSPNTYMIIRLLPIIEYASIAYLATVGNIPAIFCINMITWFLSI